MVHVVSMQIALAIPGHLPAGHCSTAFRNFQLGLYNWEMWLSIIDAAENGSYMNNEYGSFCIQYKFFCIVLTFELQYSTDHFLYLCISQDHNFLCIFNSVLTASMTISCRHCGLFKLASCLKWSQPSSSPHKAPESECRWYP